VTLVDRSDNAVVDDRLVGGPDAVIKGARRRAGRTRRRCSWIVVVLILASVGCLAGGLGAAGSARGAPYSPPAPTAPGPLAVDVKAWSGDGMLAFVSRSHLYVLGSNGRLSRISGPPASGFDSNPAWSAGGGLLAFLHTGPASGYDVPPPTLWVLAAGSTRATRVTAAPVSSFHWSPTGSVLAYISPIGQIGTGMLWRESFAPRTAPERLLANVESLLWSPSGGQLAALVRKQRTNALEVIPAAGGRATRWASIPDACVTLASWAPAGERIAAWVDGGCVDDADGEPLDVIAPGVAPRQLAWAIIDLFSLSWSPDGRTLAVVTPGGRSVWWSDKHIELCSMTVASCRVLPKPAGDAALEPAWSASSGTLYYVTASDSGPFSNNGNADWAPGWIAEWENTSRAWELPLGASSPSELPAATGHVLAFDSSRTSAATLLVRDDALWLLAQPAGAPVRIAGPLLASSAPSGYYGEIDWTALFSWSAAPGPSEVASQASATLPDELEAVPNPPS